MNNTIPEQGISAPAPTTQPINATATRRFLTILAIKIMKHFPEPRGSVLFLSKNICVKIRGGNHLGEISTMGFVAKHTSIPVPRVYCSFIRNDTTYIVMERMHGTMLGMGLLQRPEESKATVLKQLKTMVEELRRIPPSNGTAVCHVDGGPLQDPRMPGSNRFGPFKTIQDFHRYLRNDIEAHPTKTRPEFNKLISMQDSVLPPVVSTHGDLSSLNVLAAGDNIIGIIDWETSGWYPSYREYTSAWNVNPYNPFWREEVDKFLQPLPEELEMEQIRLRYFGDFW